MTPKQTINRKVVTNLSRRVLSNNEVDCLTNGLDFGLVPAHVDDMGVISNVEQFFHHVTNIYQNHKSLMSELEEKTKTSAEVRVLTAQEMALASNLRSITDSFRFQANRFCHKRYGDNPEHEQYRSVLMHLKEDKSLVITRPDKGRGVVLMNKNEYLSKMYAIVNDSSKFKRLSTDPTVAREQNLIKLLNRLLKEKSITEQFFKMSCPKGSNPGRLYGLPKIHKDNIPLRPVLSAIGTFNYGLGKALTNILSDIIEKEKMVRDPFSFVEELKTLPKSFSNYKMVSFDISSLYTNVPLDETIEIILKNLYETRATPPTIQRDDMKQLLIFATKNTHFLFDNNLYDQVDGVSMGSPLAPLLAEIFLQDFEKKHSSTFTSMGIVYWKRYVDDTFVLIDSTFSAKDICTKLSQFQKSIKFTCEEEAANTNTVSFLNILIQKQPGIGFATKVHRKETFSGLITKWSSFVPKAYKYNAISTLVYRAIKLCSSYKRLHQEFRFIRKLGTKNGYPINFVNSIIRRQLDLLYNPPAPKPPTPNTDIVVVRVPYFGNVGYVIEVCYDV
ncbi:unnamed protein product [Rotaria sp. Silwood1]|nr:unnamed protein product [Rotaria sp. Silwood1]